MDKKIKPSLSTADKLVSKKLKKTRIADPPDRHQIVEQAVAAPDEVPFEEPNAPIDPAPQALSTVMEATGESSGAVDFSGALAGDRDFGHSLTLAQNTAPELPTNSAVPPAVTSDTEPFVIILGGIAIAGLAGGGASKSTDSSSGSGSPSSSPGSTVPSSGGSLADGYISNALVFRDVNNNGVWDKESFTDTNNNGIYDTGETFVDANADGLFTAEAYVLTNASGAFTGLTGTGKIVATYLTDSSGNVLTKDVSTGLSFSSTYAAPDGSTIVNPLTSLIAAQLSSSTATATEIAAAQTKVLASFGITLPTGSSLLTYDPLAVSSDSATAWATAVAVQKVAAQVANTIQVLASAATGTDTSMSNATAAMAALTALATTVSAGTTIDLSTSASISSIGSTMTGTLVSAGTWTVANGALVSGQVTAAASSLATINTAINNISATSGSTSSVWANVASTQKVAQSTLTTAIKTSSQGGSAVDASAFSGTALTTLISAAASDTTAPVAPTIALTTDSGSSSSDKITNTGLLTISGKETNATVQYSINGGVSWLTAFTAVEGVNKVQARQIDAAGNVSVASSTLTFTLDKTAPTAPTVNTASADDIINSAERTAGVTITGTTESGSTVTVNGNAATVTGTTWSYTFNAAAIDALTILNSTGSTELTVIATDAAGNTTTTKAWPKIDTTAPNAPTITSVTDDVAPVTGTLLNGSWTNDTTPTIRVSLTSTDAVAGDSVQIYNGTTALGTATTLTSTNITNGFVDITTSALSQGAYTLNAKVIDIAGNVSSASSSFTTTVDTSIVDINAPNAPTITLVTDDILPITGTLSTGGSTNDTTPTIRVSLSGTNAIAGNTVQLYNGTTDLGVATTLISTNISNGYIDIIPSALSQGTYVFRAKVINAAGNASSASSSFTATVDTTAPAVASILFSSATGALNSYLNAGDIVTATVTMSEGVTVGGAPQLALNIGGATVQGTYDSTNSSATALRFTYTILAGQTDTNGISIAANSLGLNSGTIIDLAGNLATLTHVAVTDNSAYRVDTTGPSLTLNTVTSDDLINSAERTAGVTITGTVEAGASVTVNGNAATVAGTTWSYTFNAAAINALTILDSSGSTELTVVATDAAGNATASKAFPKIDTAAPGAPTITSVTDDVPSITGSLTSGGSTNDTTPTIRVSLTGTNAVAGDSVQLYNSTTTLGIATTLASTNISSGYVDITTSTLTQGTYSFNAKVIDIAGNASIASSSFTTTLDITAPSLATRSYTVQENTTTVATLAATSVETLTYSLGGTGPDNALFSITSGGALSFLAAKNYEQPGSASRTNTYAVTVNVSDAAGNVRNQTVTVNVSNVSETVSGTVLDGYVAGATIFQDLNNNNVLDAGEPNTVTNSTGQFILPSVVGSPNAPIKMISGFDIGTNEPIITTLGVPSTGSGVVVASPLSTIIALASSNQPNTSTTALQSRLASYLGITEAAVTKVNLLSDNPLNLLNSTDSTVVAAAKTIFAANQYVMSLAHISGSIAKYMAKQFESQADTYLATLGLTNIDVLGSTDAYEKVGSDAIFKRVAADIAPSSLVSTNTFQLNSTYVTLTDYDPSTGNSAAYRVPISVTANVGNIGFEKGSLNFTNLSNAINNTGNWQSPQISFDLQKLASGSGSAAFTIKLLEGVDATRVVGEREAGFTVNLTWTSDGSVATVNAPVQSISGYYYDRLGNRATVTFSNLDSDLLTITQAGPITPATLNLKLQALISKLSAISPGSFLAIGDYYLQVSSTIPLAASDGTRIDSFNVPISVKTGTEITLFAQDAQFSEVETVKEVGLFLNQASTSDVTVRYHFGNGTATSGSDYTATTGTATIKSGATSFFVAVPVLTDNIVESNETMQLIIDSVTGATAMNTTATITIKDALASSTLYGNLSSTSTATAVTTQAEADLATAFQSRLAQTMVTVGGQSRTLASVLSGHVDASTLISQYDALGQKILIATWSKLQTIFESYSSLGATDYARSAMVTNAGAKAFDLDQVVGDIFSSAGAYLANKSVTNLNTLIDNYVTLAGDTIGDIFGTDTGTYFSGASIVMLTRGNDTQVLTNSSEIVAGLGGNDTVDMAGGNDKYIGGAGVDTVSGGAGNDWIYGYRGNDVLSGGDGNDVISAGAGDDLIDGGLGNDTLLGESGNDAISGGGGSDTINAGLGDDTISVGGTSGGAFTTVVDGSSGTDSLTINYSGITSLGSYTSTISGDYTVLTDASGNVIQYKNIESLTVGSYAYTNNTSSKYFYSASERAVYLYQGGTLSGSNFSSGPFFDLQGTSNNLRIVGSGAVDSVSMGFSRTGTGAATGNVVISLGEGNDTITMAKLANGDSIDMGAGDDIVEVTVDAYQSPQTLANLNVSKLDGGAGSDTLSFTSTGFTTHTDGAALRLTTGNATNFENLIGTYYADTIYGNDSSNYLYGYSGGSIGNDVIYGLGGNDFLLANNNTDGGSDRSWLVTPAVGSDLSGKLNFLTKFDATGNVKLYGGSGDDVLIGGKGEDTLDGGQGRDHMAGGSGIDTFVLRAGDGSTSSISLADIIYDFTDGADILGLTGSLNFTDLTITQGTGTNTSTANTVIMRSNEYLAVLLNTQATNITLVDFQQLQVL